MTRIAAAVVFMVVLVFGSLLMRTTRSITLVDVLRRIEQASVYVYQMHMTITHSTDSNTPQTSEMFTTATISIDHGTKIAIENTNPDSGAITFQEIYMQPAEKVLVTVLPGQKKYQRMELDETLITQIQQQNSDPQYMIKRLLECNYTRLDKSVAVEGFQTSDPAIMGESMPGSTFTLWVNRKTGLPIRSHRVMNMGQMRIKTSTHRYLWDVSVDADFFEPAIPDDYQNLMGTDINIQKPLGSNEPRAHLGNPWLW